ncbi:MAG: hypothetical protein JJU41_04880 [Bacteroidetes bacterium]|nr:hypothetical protein [Bacteroidota bacterium]
MEKLIRSGLEHPAELESLYRADKAAFLEAFRAIYPEIEHHIVAQVWHERLKNELPQVNSAEVNSTEVGGAKAGGAEASGAKASGTAVSHTLAKAAEKSPSRTASYFENLSWGTRKDWMFIAIAALIAGFIANIPNLFGLEGDEFYPRNLGFVVFPFLTAYMAWKYAMPAQKGWILGGATLVALAYINLLPSVDTSDSIPLACMHLPLLLWSGFGYAYAHEQPGDASRRLNFLRFNGELVVMGVLLLITGMIFFAITVALFEMVGIQIYLYLGDHFLLWILPSIPLLAVWLVLANPKLVSLVSPVIARVFTPASLIMLAFYFVAILMNASALYQDRDFLLIFNTVLIGVLALIMFSLSELANRDSGKIRFSVTVLFLLSVVTLLINAIALSAIVYRVVEWGITPNRIAVLGANVLFLIHLMRITVSLYQSMTGRSHISAVETRIATYLPVYIIWLVVVVFLFPIVFGFG